jgi:hypothetical protein
MQFGQSIKKFLNQMSKYFSFSSCILFILTLIRFAETNASPHHRTFNYESRKVTIACNHL